MAVIPLHMPRNNSLDALRGLSILLMVLSGSIAFGGVLPAWMYHAQVPPPAHQFDPSIPGITWVDLVFPFFLFSMGAAIPLALGKWEGKPNATRQVWWIATRRLLLLTWFALFTFHMRAWVMAEQPTSMHYAISILAFGLLFLELYRPAAPAPGKIWLVLRIAAYSVSAGLLLVLPFNKGEGFLPEKSDIIILVLGNMAFFGSLAWWYTRHQPLLRLGLLPFIMAVFLGAKEPGSWNEVVFNWSPLPWIYKFYYLKYLFIIIPGTLAGEWMKSMDDKEIPAGNLRFGGTLLLVLTAMNVALLFQRSLVLNMILTPATMLLVYSQLRHFKNTLSYKLFTAGSYLLLLGLCFEAYEGGIRKDSSTYSYYFVTSGLAFYLLIIFNAWQEFRIGHAINRFLAANGQNPMVAYVAGNLVVTPLLHLTGLIALWNTLNQNAWLGFLKGVLFTAIVAIITLQFTRRKWYWKT